MLRNIAPIYADPFAQFKSLYFKPSDQPKPISNSFIMKVLIVLAISFAALTSADHVAGGHHHPVHHHQFQQPRQARAPQFNNFRQYPSAPAPTPATLPTIAEAAVGTPSLSTLVAALKAADLVEAFAGEGKFTVFAPNNDAFAKIPADALSNLLLPENKQDLKKVLLRHVVSGWIIKAGDIPAGNTGLITFGNEPITVTNANGGVSIQSSAGTANVIATDVIASNGVVHVVDTVF